VASSRMSVLLGRSEERWAALTHLRMGRRTPLSMHEREIRPALCCMMTAAASLRLEPAAALTRIGNNAALVAGKQLVRRHPAPGVAQLRGEDYGPGKRRNDRLLLWLQATTNKGSSLEASQRAQTQESGLSSCSERLCIMQTRQYLEPASIINERVMATVGYRQRLHTRR
jgi:hypothetical protein